ncbi:MAG: helix-turn-helix domain-containing protein [Clostridia bacterium]|nr:helix-turn-helix domain-containing protein [Clostridia bacterium]
MISMNIKYLRKKFSLSQEELAEKIGVSRQSIAKWENGESLPDIQKCADMAFLFEVSLDAFVMSPIDESVEVKEEPSEGRYVFGLVKVGERGQVVIPKHARKVYDIKAGDKLLVLGDNRGMAFAKINNMHIFTFGG